jgi:hypothetical protein
MSWYILGGAVLVISGVVFLFIRNRPQDKNLYPIGVQKKDRHGPHFPKPKQSLLP